MSQQDTLSKVIERVKGLIIPIPTVFDGKGEVDVEVLEQLTDWYLDRGVHGLFALGSKGQGAACRIDQRKLVAETVIRRVKGRIPVMVQVGAVDPYTSIELGRHAAEIGADAIGIVGPYYYSDRTEYELTEHYKMIDAAVGLPVFLYDNPEYSGYSISANMMAKLKRVVPNIFGAKLAKGNTGKAQQYMRVLGKQFSIFIPVNHMLPAMLLGVRGSIAAGSPTIVPEIGVQFIEAIWAEDFVRAQQIQILMLEQSERTAPLNRKYRREVTCAGLRLRGIPVKQYPRWPTEPMTPEDKALLDESIRGMLDGLRGLRSAA